jgi:hypothetical protein
MDDDFEDIEARIFGEAQLFDAQDEPPQLEQQQTQRGATRLQKESRGRLPSSSGRSSLPRIRRSQSNRLPQHAGCPQQEQQHQQQQQQEGAPDREHLQQQTQSAQLQGALMPNQLQEPDHDPLANSQQQQQQQEPYIEDEILAAEIGVAAAALGDQPHPQPTGGPSSHVQRQQLLQSTYRKKRPSAFTAFIARYAVPPSDSLCSCCGAESRQVAVTRCLDCSVNLDKCRELHLMWQSDKLMSAIHAGVQPASLL